MQSCPHLYTSSPAVRCTFPIAITVWLMKPRACAAFSGGEGKVRSLRDLSLIVSSSASAGVFSAVADPIPAWCLEPPGEPEPPPPPLPPGLPPGGPLPLRNKFAVSLGLSHGACGCHTCDMRVSHHHFNGVWVMLFAFSGYDGFPADPRAS